MNEWPATYSYGEAPFTHLHERNKQSTGRRFQRKSGIYFKTSLLRDFEKILLSHEEISACSRDITLYVAERFDM